MGSQWGVNNFLSLFLITPELVKLLGNTFSVPLLHRLPASSLQHLSCGHQLPEHNTANFFPTSTVLDEVKNGLVLLQRVVLGLPPEPPDARRLMLITVVQDETCDLATDIVPFLQLLLSDSVLSKPPSYVLVELLPEGFYKTSGSGIKLTRKQEYLRA